MKKIKSILNLGLIIGLSMGIFSASSLIINNIDKVNANEIDRTFYYTEELKDKAIVFYGDSITARYGLKSYHKDYIQILQEEFGFYYSNQAVSGATWSVSSTSTNNIFSQLEKSEALYRDADYISIFLGTNDFGSSRTIGNVDDNDNSTIYGAINIALNTIIDANPDVKIMLITALNRYDFADSNLNDNGLTNSGGYTIEDIRNVIRTSANNYNCSLVELGDLVNEDNMSTILNTDKLHVVEEGYYEVAKAIKKVQA